MLGRTGDQSRSEGAWDDDAVSLGRDDVSDFNEEQILPLPSETQQKITEWLQPTDYGGTDSEHAKHRGLHLAGTGQWLLDSGPFKEWHDSQEHGILWIRGVPGSGKSVFAASIIDRLQSEQVPVLYFYFRQIIDVNHDPVTALHDWLAQILPFSPPVQMQLKEYLDTGRSLNSIATGDLWRHLRAACPHLPRVYLVVDALDEMDQSRGTDAFLSSLAELGQWHPQQLKIIITSRPVVYLERALRLTKMLNIRLEEQKVDVDISIYVQYRLSLSTISKNECDAILHAVPGRANGLFLYAKLAMDAFLEPGADVQKVLQTLPSDLNIMYTDLLQEHAKRTGVPHHIQLLVLQSITHASRPLRLLELAEMINVTQFPQDKRDLKETKDLVRLACGPLLEILPDETICVIHHSLTEFLIGETREETVYDYPVLKHGPTHSLLATTCLSYLLSGPLDEIKVKSHVPGHDSFITTQSLPPFARYAASNWFVHIRKAADAGMNQDDSTPFIDTLLNAENITKWVLLAKIHDIPERPTPLFVAVALGLNHYTKILLSRPGTTMSRGSMENSPLNYASSKGYDKIVDLLLRHGADATESDGMPFSGLTPLHYAASNNHPQVIRLLLDTGVSAFILTERQDDDDFDSVDHTSETHSAIAFAIRHGHCEAVAAFLPYLKQAKEVQSVFAMAMQAARPPIIKLIAGHPLIDVNAKSRGPIAQTPLLKASGHRDTTSVRLLLSAGADCNILHESPEWPGDQPGNGRGYTALHAWAEWRYAWPHDHYADELDAEGTTECFHLLLASGANLHQQDIKGNTPLHYAFDVVAARLLLEAGANPNAVNDEGETILHRCREKEALQILLDDGRVDTGLKAGREQRTPLLSYLAKDTNDAVEYALKLLDFGADAAGSDKDGNGSFHHAVGIPFDKDWGVADKRLELIERLCKAGADINLRNHKGQAPIHVIGIGIGRITRGDIEEPILAALISAGAALEARDREGKTLLFEKIETGFHRGPERIALCEKLVRAGARLDVTDYRGRTLLHAAVTDNELAFCKWLVEHGVDPKQTDHYGNTLFHEPLTTHARYSYGKNSSRTFELFEALRAMGVDPEMPNHAGRTPLHVISAIRSADFDDHDDYVSDGTTNMFDYILGLQSNVDMPDNEGITALHLASTFSEYHSRRLLEAGADPSKITDDGMNALHLAARSRQANVVGMLVESLVARVGHDRAALAINCRDSLWNTPLYYACLSGHIESVRFLIESGAEIEKSAVDGCVAFETELKTRSPHDPHDRTSPHAGAVTVTGKSRGRHGRDDKFPTERIDEISEVLVREVASIRATVDDKMALAGRQGLDYTVDCLLQARKAVGLDDGNDFDYKVQACIARKQATRAILRNHFHQDETQLQLSEKDLEHLIQIREYEIAAEILAATNCLQVGSSGIPFLHEMVARGFTSIVEKVATPELVKNLDDPDWCESFEASTPALRDGTLEPLLFAACRRQQPNMDMVRLLIEKFGANPNAQKRHIWRNNPSGKGESVLHVLVTNIHWWQAAQALPYLAQHGADIELRDIMGSSPLNVALEKLPGRLGFNKRAVEMLLKLGANANVADNINVTCLARVCEDGDVTRLLLRFGAVATQQALVSAIYSKNAEVLEMLLMAGVDPNTRKESDEAKGTPSKNTPWHRQSNRPRWLSKEELYPLHYAASSRETRNDPELEEKMIRTLLAHGADPGARYADKAIMHHIIETNSHASLFLHLPNLDIEATDSTGRTLFLVACAAITYQEEQNMAEPEGAGKLCRFRVLLDRGANVEACDNDGQNALHWVLCASQRMPHTVRFMLNLAPSLANQANKAGRTPLHNALGRINCRIDQGEARILLQAGADPSIILNNRETSLHILLKGDWWVKIDGTVGRERRKVFDLLLAAPATNINARDNAGESPVFGFFRDGGIIAEADEKKVFRNGDERYNHKLVVSEQPVFDMFDAAGVDWTVKNNKKQSLLHVAVSRGDDWKRPGRTAARFKFLLSKGLDPLAEDSKHRTPLDLAAELGVKSIMEMFERK